MVASLFFLDISRVLRFLKHHVPNITLVFYYIPVTITVTTYSKNEKQVIP